MSAICAHIGRLQESLLAHQRAQRSNPKTRTANLEFYYLYSGDFERAEEAGEALCRERPGSNTVARPASPRLIARQKALMRPAERTSGPPMTERSRGECHGRTGHLEPQ